MSDPVETHQTGFSQTADSLRDVAELLSDAEDRVNGTQSLNLKSRTALRHLEVMWNTAGVRRPVSNISSLQCHINVFSLFNIFQHLQTQLEKKQRTFLPVTEITKDLLNNITDIFLLLEEIKKVSRCLLLPQFHETSFGLRKQRVFCVDIEGI